MLLGLGSLLLFSSRPPSMSPHRGIKEVGETAMKWIIRW